jgi:hypothetical protein
VIVTSDRHDSRRTTENNDTNPHNLPLQQFTKMKLPVFAAVSVFTTVVALVQATDEVSARVLRNASVAGYNVTSRQRQLTSIAASHK